MLTISSGHFKPVNSGFNGTVNSSPMGTHAMCANCGKSHLSERAVMGSGGSAREPRKDVMTSAASDEEASPVGDQLNASPIDDSHTPPGKLGELVAGLRRILGPNKGLNSEDIDIKKVQELMENYQSNEEEWGRYGLHDGSRNYSRNGVVDINGNANLLILVWTPGKSSAIHDHAKAHCCMKILKGQLMESLYDFPESEGYELKPRKNTTMHREEVGYISDDIGLHRISNPSSTDLAVSLHLYTPPYASMYGCSMYEANSGKRHHVDMSKYYSWQGKLVNKSNSSTC